MHWLRSRLAWWLAAATDWCRCSTQHTKWTHSLDIQDGAWGPCSTSAAASWGNQPAFQSQDVWIRTYICQLQRVWHHSWRSRCGILPDLYNWELPNIKVTKWCSGASSIHKCLIHILRELCEGDSSTDRSTKEDIKGWQSTERQTLTQEV